MVIAVSACLLGTCCKYSGGNNLNETLVKALAGHELIPICPEVEGGLPVPRPPAELVNGVVMTREGRSVDAAFRLGVERVMQRLEGRGVTLVILQPRSPSCGVHQIYDGTFTGTRIDGSGLMARRLMDAGIRCSEPDEAIALLTKQNP